METVRTVKKEALGKLVQHIGEEITLIHRTTEVWYQHPYRGKLEEVTGKGVTVRFGPPKQFPHGGFSSGTRTFNKSHIVKVILADCTEVS
jgi:hypothetical protein